MPPHRPYVVDELERLHTFDYDYTPLGQWFSANPAEAGVCLIEWDIALEPIQYALFAGMALSRPEEPLVAPHYLHHVEPGRSVWAHRRLTATGERWIQYQETLCDYFAFGLIYLPRPLVVEFLAAPAPERGRPPVAPGGYEDVRFTDQTFSVWYRHRCSTGGPVHVEWSVQPVHLHGPREQVIGV